ncbi:TetR/AcrR family transcriptional regulator [Tenggerimyces flavus]|uniref:TetR/AcrR family transcriptional regulator n=1 Tax=Tenggerimyces flavus TaxID=1708749 RepID=A0ABV7Y8H6_9ACTN|nr:TetR family transcriptional regulator [Tenggerimyces flavus]MBM7783617.1 AcrR family transcriptional regulator [Tenggerimyces flavus]
MVRVPADERRRQLVEAALVVASREGVDAATTRRIAKEAGVSLGIVHYCFRSKAELLQEMIKAIVDEMGSSVQLATLRKGDVRTVLQAGLDNLWQTVGSAPERHLLTYELTAYTLRQGMTELTEWLYECYFQTSRAFLESVAEAANVEWTQPVDELAKTVVAINEGVTLQWLVDRDPKAVQLRYETFLDYLAGQTRRARRRATG